MRFIKYVIIIAVLAYWTMKINNTCDTINGYISYEKEITKLQLKMDKLEEEIRTTVPFIRMEATAAKEYLDDIRDIKKKK